MAMVSRRSFVGLGIGLGMAGLGAAAYRSARLHVDASRQSALYAIQGHASFGLGARVPVFSYTHNPDNLDAIGPPVLTARQGETFSTRFYNRIPSPSTVHWHGIRVPFAMDGVPLLTQNPVFPGESFSYRFSIPDAGTYWYHPHYASLDQIGRGLSGLLVVHEKDDPGYDADLPLLLRDWRLDEAGAWQALSTPRTAARAGTFGGVHTVNWRMQPRYEVPAGGLVRLRLCNTDVTRIFRVIPKGAPAIVVALDGHPVAQPFPLGREMLGPGMRIDVVVRMPDEVGGLFELRNVSSSHPWTMVQLVAQGTSRRRLLSDICPLPLNPVSHPDLDQAAVRTIRMDFNAAPGGGSGMSLWSINKRSWIENVGRDPNQPAFPLLPGQDFSQARAAICGGGDPLETLEYGRSYMFELNNFTPHLHPIHIHGLTFMLVSSNRRRIRAGQFTDTALLLPKERLKIALVADNIGEWMVHCHIIEHQIFGMMGTIKVRA